MQPTNQPYGPQQTPYGGGPATDAPPPAPRLDITRLWAGGVMTAGVAGLTAVAAVTVVRGALGFQVFTPEGDTSAGGLSPGLLACGTAVVALVATGLLHLLILTTPRPARYLGWIITLVTAALVLLPFRTGGALEPKVGTGVVYLAIGAALGSLLSAVGRGATRRSL
ncbi:DUF6069 family protein [Streptomyces sp. NPDC001595]|uniref:DUF6069 family protein n=1 Tax=Streptomyces sp. NPDC001532 TaxID=3154520 RepID=UPI0033267E93